MGVEKLLFRNFTNAAWVIGSVIGAHCAYWHLCLKNRINADVFGLDGNGGKMLRIITDLTDEEMARLKHARRLMWHWRGSRKMFQGHDEISNQELADRGIQIPQEPYAEYLKRPPHDKYL